MKSSRIVGLRLASRFCSVLGATALSAFAAEPISAPVVEQTLINLNSELITALQEHDGRASPANFRGGDTALRARTPYDTTTRLIEVAKLRQTRLLKLLKTHPELVAARILPAALRHRLPAEAQAFVEQEVELTGTVKALHVDVLKGVSPPDQFFLTQVNNAGADLKLTTVANGSKDDDMLRHVGRKVTVKAHRLDGQLILLEQASLTQVPAPASSGIASAVAAVTGSNSVLVIAGTFRDKALECTTTDLNDRVFGATKSVDQVVRQSSHGKVSLNGKVVGPFKIAFDAGTTCDWPGWGTALKAAAKAAGVDLAQFQNFNYTMPADSSCGWAGLSYLGGNETWVQYCGLADTYAHEFGHTLNLHHAGIPSTNALTSEYGDLSDVMGFSTGSLRQFGAAQRVLSGWLPATSVSTVLTGSTYAISSLELAAPASPQVLKIAKKDTNNHYYVSMRQRLDLDSGLRAQYVDNISVHYANNALPAKTTLVANLAPGQNYTDSINGIVLKNLGINGTTATVDVTLANAPACLRAAPRVDLAPAAQTAAPGATLVYNLTVTNQNSAGCGSARFDLAPVDVATGLSVVLSTGSMSLASQVQAGASVKVTSAAASANAPYSFGIAATESGQAAGGRQSGSYIVYKGPTDINGGPALAITYPTQGAAVTGIVPISATASDSSGVAKVEFFIDNGRKAVATVAPYVYKWNASNAADGIHVIKVRAFDGTGKTTESSITVTAH